MANIWLKYKVRVFAIDLNGIPVIEDKHFDEKK